MANIKNTDLTSVREKELENCSYVKTFLMTAVVLYHSLLFWTGNWFTSNPAIEASPLGVLASWLNTFHIYGFTLVSGYLFYYLKHECGKYSQFLPYLKKKVQRLLIPYFFVAIFWVIPIDCLWRDMEVSLVIRRFLLGTSPSQLWFLLMLFLVYTFAWPISDFLSKHDVLSGIICIACYGIGLVGSLLLPNIFQIWTACMYFVFFVLGFKIRQHGSRILMKIPALVWLAFSLILFSCHLLLQGKESAIIRIIDLGLTFAGNLVGAAMAFASFQKLAAKLSEKGRRAVKKLAKFSMPIYLFHQQIIYLLIFLLNGMISPYLHVWINFAGALILSAALSAILMKFRPTRFLIGEK